MIKHLLTLSLIAGGYFSCYCQSVSFDPELINDIKQRFPNCEIGKTTIRGESYHALFALEDGVKGGISYQKSDGAFEKYNLTFQGVPDALLADLTARIELSEVIITRFIKRANQPGYYYVRTKKGGFSYGEDYQYLKNGLLLNGLDELPAPILSHLQGQYENLTIKETGIDGDGYFTRIEFKSGAVLAQPGIVKYTRDFEWVDTSFYYWDLTRLPLDLFLAMDVFGGIEAVVDARQFFPASGEVYYQVTLTNKETVYFDHLFEVMQAPN